MLRAGKVPALVPLPALLPAAGPDHTGRVADADHVARLLLCLSPRDRLITWRVLGEGRLQADVAREAGLDPSRVCQIVRGGLALLREVWAGRAGG